MFRIFALVKLKLLLMSSYYLAGVTIMFHSYGRYYVEYTTKRGDYYIGLCSDMELIDTVRDENVCTRADVARLKRYIRDNGFHYSKYGKRID